MIWECARCYFGKNLCLASLECYHFLKANNHFPTRLWNLKKVWIEDFVKISKVHFILKEWFFNACTYSGQSAGFIYVGPEKWILPLKYREHASDIWNFRARSTDIFICTHPRSGTTWTQEMTWLMCNNLDYAKAKRKILNERVPYFEWVCKKFAVLW